MTIHGAHDR